MYESVIEELVEQFGEIPSAIEFDETMYDVDLSYVSRHFKWCFILFLTNNFQSDYCEITSSVYSKRYVLPFADLYWNVLKILLSFSLSNHGFIFKY